MNSNVFVCVCPASEGPALEVNGWCSKVSLEFSVISNVQLVTEHLQDACLKISHNNILNDIFYSDFFLFNKLQYSLRTKCLLDSFHAQTKQIILK